MRIDGETAEVGKALKALNGVKSVRAAGEKEPGVYEYEVSQESGADVRRAVFSTAAAHGWPILAMSNGAMSLEDVFIKLTSASYAKSKELPQNAGEGGDEE